MHYKFMEATLDTNFKLNCSQVVSESTQCHVLTVHAVGLSRHARVARKKKDNFVVIFKIFWLNQEP